MRVIVIGSGGREHTLTWKLRQSKEVTDIFCLPGNAGTSSIANNIDIKADDIQSIVNFCNKNSPRLVVIGPEDPLAAGLAGIIRENKINVFGPSLEGARLESSKSFAKELMQRHGIPTGKTQKFDDYQRALKYLENTKYPIVVKANGLAAGKGVFICHGLDNAKKALEQCFIEKKFGGAGKTVLIEEFLEGQEVSLLCFTDGKSFRRMEPAQDYKAIYDGDQGPNTGGMGCYSPVPAFTDSLLDKAINEIVEPTVSALNKEKIDFRGVLYCGLILTKDGPKVLEYNVRFGDPETQVMLPRLSDDLFNILMATATRQLEGMTATAWSQNTCLTVVLASKGYPGSYNTGFPIEGIEEAEQYPGVTVFHAGTALKDDQIVTAGGRVLNVTAIGQNFKEARDAAYKAAEKIQFSNKYNRSDIGLRAIDEVKEEQHCLR